MRRTLLILQLAACGGKSAHECRTEAHGLASLLREAPHGRVAFVPEAGVTLVNRTDLTQSGAWEAVVIVANDRTMTSRGMPVEAIDLHDLLTKQRERGAPPEVYFQLDRAIPWRQVVELVDTAKLAGFTHVGFAFDTGEKLTPPPRTPIDDKLDPLMSGDASDPSDRAVKLAKLIESTVEDCPALTEGFGNVGEDSTESKADVIIRRLAPALIECRCKVDLPALRSVLWRLIVVEPSIKVLTFDATVGDTLAFPAATTWEVASKKLLLGTNYQLAVQ